MPEKCMQSRKQWQNSNIICWDTSLSFEQILRVSRNYNLKLFKLWSNRHGSLNSQGSISLLNIRKGLLTKLLMRCPEYSWQWQHLSLSFFSSYDRSCSNMILRVTYQQVWGLILTYNSEMVCGFGRINC